VFILLPHVGHSLVRRNIFVDLFVTMVIGGPHLFATYTMTAMKPAFRERYPLFRGRAAAARHDCDTRGVEPDAVRDSLLLGLDRRHSSGGVHCGFLPVQGPAAGVGTRA